MADLEEGPEGWRWWCIIGRFGEHRSAWMKTIRAAQGALDAHLLAHEKRKEVMPNG